MNFYGKSIYTITHVNAFTFSMYAGDDFRAWERECRPGLWQRFRSSDFCKGMLMFWGYT